MSELLECDEDTGAEDQHNPKLKKRMSLKDCQRMQRHYWLQNDADAFADFGQIRMPCRWEMWFKIVRDLCATEPKVTSTLS